MRGFGLLVIEGKSQQHQQDREGRAQGMCRAQEFIWRLELTGSLYVRLGREAGVGPQRALSTRLGLGSIHGLPCTERAGR